MWEGGRRRWEEVGGGGGASRSCLSRYRRSPLVLTLFASQIHTDGHTGQESAIAKSFDYNYWDWFWVLGFGVWG